MIELAPHHLPALADWFPTGGPGSEVVAQHVLTTGVGSWWADRKDRPRLLAASCADHVVLRGSAEALAPEDLAPLAGTRVDAPDGFLPSLSAAFDQLTPWKRMVWTLQATPQPFTAPRGTTVRRLEPADTDAVHDLGPDAAWLAASWGGPLGLAVSGHAWAAFDRRQRITAVSCTYFRGTSHEEVAAYTTSTRGHRLALACVIALCADIRARGHTPSWNCSVHNRASRLLAWFAGFRLVRGYVHYAVGNPAGRFRLAG
ncbi:GNAT family N-acetyltransferase [Streptomyces parvulus]|uniref:GNAT family N-acetyltransferase n=1 Tax=Streptomyces parvulus TaxID=146923 RepID=UPI0034041E30